MKKIFQNIVDRIHVIYLVLTRKHFVFSCYNKVDVSSKKISGAGFVEQFSDNKDETKMFLQVVYELGNDLIK